MNIFEKIIDFENFITASSHNLYELNTSDYIELLNDETKLFTRYLDDQNTDSDVVELRNSISSFDPMTFYNEINHNELIDFRYELILNGNSKNDINFFTVSSREDFSELASDSNGLEWGKSLMYTPLNDHSRKYLTKGDILFCNRFGQFEDLNVALETRGIYALGIALTDPIVIDESKSDHHKFGIIIGFPQKLKQHLDTKNIQMNPITIDLTPYNGNRNDALQYINNPSKAHELLNMMIRKNPDCDYFVQKFSNHKPISRNLPIEILSSHYESDSQFDIKSFDHFLELISKQLLTNNFKFDKKLIINCICALLSKPFLILTGLSGSGKTKLAQIISYSFSTTQYVETAPNRFKLNDEIVSERAKYKVIETDSIATTFIQADSGTKVTLPYDLIEEWIRVIREKGFTEETTARTIRDVVNETSTFSRQLNNSDTHLKTASFHLIKNPQREVSSNQVLMIPVGADWTNREPLLGYPNALEQGKYVKPDSGVLDLIIEANKPENRLNPYFIVLDEMNLSHVERYFADFLSAMESDEPIYLHPDSNAWKENGEWKEGIPDKIYLPDNLFIIGTVNIDETTYMFSPKVLDRANVIEFRVSAKEMEDFLRNPGKPDLKRIKGLGANMASDFVKNARQIVGEFEGREIITEELFRFFNELRKVGAEFGYRTAMEIVRFSGIITKLTKDEGDNWETDEIIDAVVMQKLLPKLHGARKKLEPVLISLADLCLGEGTDINDIVKHYEKELNLNNYKDNIRYPLSLEKILRMRLKVINDGFTSFAEA